jgi:hypothetical protein
LAVEAIGWVIERTWNSSARKLASIRERILAAQLNPQETQALEQWIKMSRWRRLKPDVLLSSIWKWSAEMPKER